MEWWIIYSKHLSELNENDYSVNRLLEESKKEWIILKVFKPEQFDIIVTKDDRKSIRVQEEVVKLPDFIIPRMWSETTFFALSVIRHLERLWIYVLNSSESIEMVKDKLYSIQVLAENNLPVPKTMLAKFPINIDLVEEQLKFPVVIKTLSWFQWKGVFLSEDKKSFIDRMEMIEGIWKVKDLIFQEFISFSKWMDLRVYVVWWKPVACMKRNWKDWDFRANYSLWWNIEKYEMTPEIEWIATESAKILWLDIAWIDLLFDNEHFKICEANSSPWMKWIELSNNINIPKEIFNFLRIRLWMF